MLNTLGGLACFHSTGKQWKCIYDLIGSLVTLKLVKC